MVLYRWLDHLCLCRFYRAAPRWQLRHYQRCFNASLLLYLCILSVLIVRFVTTFGRHGSRQTRNEQLASHGGYANGGKNRQPRALYNYNMAVGAYMYNMDVDELDTRRQVLKPENVPWLSAPFFPRAINKTDYDMYVDLLRTLSELFEQANVTFIMCDGTLLGSYIAHGMLPWDDDADLMVRYADINKVKAIFANASVWKKYQIIGYHDELNEYDYSVLTDGSFQKDVLTVNQETYADEARMEAHSVLINSQASIEIEWSPSSMIGPTQTTLNPFRCRTRKLKELAKDITNLSSFLGTLCMLGRRHGNGLS